MFGKDFWRILRIVYLVIKALLESDPPNGSKLEDLDNGKA